MLVSTANQLQAAGGADMLVWAPRGRTSSGVEMMFTLTTCSLRTDSEWMRLRRVRSSAFCDSACSEETAT